MDPRHTLYSLLRIGYWKDYTTLIRWVTPNQIDRHVLHCCLVGKEGVGKSSLLQYLRTESVDPDIISTTPLHTIVCEVKDQHHHDPNDWRYLLVGE